MNSAKRYEELLFTDDFMFCKVLSTDLQLTKELLELLLGVKIKKINLAEAQKAIELEADARGIRLDVYAKDEQETVYDIEMQTVLMENLPRRARYYQGMIDLNSIERGARFKELKKSYVIFICMGDPFLANLPIYTFENRCIEAPDLRLGDDTWKVFLNAQGLRSNVTREMCCFLNYIKNGIPNDPFTKRINDAVERARTHKEWRLEYMTLMMRDQEMMDKGREEGVKEGEIIGVVKICHEEFHLSMEEIVQRIMTRFSLSQDEAEEYVNRIIKQEQHGR